MQSRSMNPVHHRAHGDHRSAGLAPTASARFCWTDLESGERLEVNLRGSQAFLDALEACGFQRLDDEDEGEAGARVA